MLKEISTMNNVFINSSLIWIASINWFALAVKRARSTRPLVKFFCWVYECNLNVSVSFKSSKKSLSSWSSISNSLCKDQSLFLNESPHWLGPRNSFVIGRQDSCLISTWILRSICSRSWTKCVFFSLWYKSGQPTSFTLSVRGRPWKAPGAG